MKRNFCLPEKKDRQLRRTWRTRNWSKTSETRQNSRMKEKKTRTLLLLTTKREKKLLQTIKVSSWFVRCEKKRKWNWIQFDFRVLFLLCMLFPLLGFSISLSLSLPFSSSLSAKHSHCEFHTWRVSVVVDRRVDGGIEGISVHEVVWVVVTAGVTVVEVGRVAEVLRRGGRHRLCRGDKPKATTTTTREEATVSRSLATVTMASDLVEGVFRADDFFLDHQQLEGRDTRHTKLLKLSLVSNHEKHLSTWFTEESITTQTWECDKQTRRKTKDEVKNRSLKNTKRWCCNCYVEQQFPILYIQ
jgi:hypothetical protein